MTCATECKTQEESDIVEERENTFATEFKESSGKIASP